jgi:Uma2 family endonuclease
MEDKTTNEPIDITYGHHYTYADYLQFKMDDMVEIIKGKIFKMAPAPSSKHQRVSANLSGIFYNYFRNQPCQYFCAPFDVILPSKGKDFNASDKVVQPDIVIICDPSKIQEKGCFGAPDWIIEILSPFTAKKDLQLKFDLYEESEVGEYWIVAPLYHTIEVFVLENKVFRRVRAYAQDDIVRSHTFPDLEMDLREIFSEL